MIPGILYVTYPADAWVLKFVLNLADVQGRAGCQQILTNTYSDSNILGKQRTETSHMITHLPSLRLITVGLCKRFLSSLFKIYKEYISKKTSDKSQQQSEPVVTSKYQQTLINGQPPADCVDPSILDCKTLKQLLKDAGITHQPRAHCKTLLILYNKHLAQLALTSEPFSPKTSPSSAGVPQTNSTVAQTPTHPISAAVISQPLQDLPPPSPPDQVNQPPKRPIQTNSYTPRSKPADPSSLTMDRLRQLLKQARVSHWTNTCHSTLAKLYANHLAKHAQARSKTLAPPAKKHSWIKPPPSSPNINTNPYITAAIASSNPVYSTPNQPPPLTPHNEPFSATCSRQATTKKFWSPMASLKEMLCEPSFNCGRKNCLSRMVSFFLNPQ
ncbi:hypothetical protein VP01_3903g4 [Puccinia sorghi]|uniref:Uncharacterized protein n=1 Tax=Puccinia sorghi TaxID=27349 RepID=A0A0L6UST3_9BASI|nr:hypothetical protein VP01_3903g4 [Puccinia sorghi]